MANCCRGVAKRTSVQFSVPQLYLGASFGLSDPEYQLFTIRCLPGTRVVFRSHPLECGLYLTAVIGLVVIPLVQDQPEFEAWIGACHPHAVLFAVVYRIVKVGMFVTVEHRPDLVVLLVRIPPAAAPPREAVPLGKLNSSFGNGIGNTDTPISLHVDQRA